MSIDTPIHITLEQDGDYAFHINFQGTELDPLLSDEAAPLGNDRGPNPSSLLLASVANCLAASLLFALRKFKNSPEPIRAEIHATPMRNESGRWRIPTAQVTLHLPGNSADFKLLSRVFDQFEDFCVVTQSVRQGIEINLEVIDDAGQLLHESKDSKAGS